MNSICDMTPECFDLVTNLYSVTMYVSSIEFPLQAWRYITLRPFLLLL